MSEALTISLSGWHPADVARVRTALDLSLRNVEIRHAYRAKRKRGVRKYDALAELAHEYCLSEDAINAAVWPR